MNISFTDKITAEYIDHMGDDLRVVNAARVSFAKESALDPDTGGLAERDARLVAYLAAHDHFTPFTHPVITLLEMVPIFVARQRFRHSVGFTYNEVSRRYVSERPSFFAPSVWRSAPPDGIKQGSTDAPVAWQPHVRYAAMCEQALDLYDDMLDAGIAPEQARMVLPQSMMTSYYVTGSLAAFARAYKLRIDAHAQREIQDLARCWDLIIRPLFPTSWSMLVDGPKHSKGDCGLASEGEAA